MMKTQKAPAERLQRAEQHIDWVLSHPHVSAWLKDCLRTARKRDPVQTMNDLELLALLLQERSGALVDKLWVDEPCDAQADRQSA